MKKLKLALALFFCLFLCVSPGRAEDFKDLYVIGVDDILEIKLIQPDEITSQVTVAPDGTITFPFIGVVEVKGVTLPALKKEIESRLDAEYMAYPVVYVSLVESRSRKFFVYGEVIKPGTYPLEENTTVLRAISMSGGFTKYGSSSRVKLLRPKKDQIGYESIKININSVMDGEVQADMLLQSGDILVVS